MLPWPVCLSYNKFILSSFKLVGPSVGDKIYICIFRYDERDAYLPYIEFVRLV